MKNAISRSSKWEHLTLDTSNDLPVGPYQQGMTLVNRWIQLPNTSLLVVLTLMISLTGCVSQESGTLSPSTPTSSSTDSPSVTSDDPNAFEVVDCLLPGQVRRLGAKVVYLSPRRPVRDTALDCTMRGGEYVSYDRADYQNSLEVWKKAADAGNVDGEYYVAVLYERGVKGTPEFDKAADWYQKAAEHGHRQAAMNLGRLYDQGLGVPKSSEKAFLWYTKASGLKAESLGQLLDHSANQEIKTLQQTVSLREHEIRQLEKTLTQTQEEKSQLEIEIDLQQKVIDNDNRQIATLEAQYTQLQTNLESVKNQPDRDPEIRSYQAQLKALQAELIRRQQALHGQDETIVALEQKLAELSESEQRVHYLEGLTTTQDEEVQQLRAQLAQIQAETLATQQQLARKEQVVAQERLKVQEVKSQTTSMSEQIQQLQDQQERERQRLEQFQKEYSQTKQELEARKQEVLDREKKIAELQNELEQIQDSRSGIATTSNPSPGKDLGMEGPTIQIIDPPLVVKRGVSVVAGRQPVYLSSDATRTLTGRVLAPAGLWELRVNGMAMKVDPQGMFNVDLPLVRSGQTPLPVDILAVDVQNKRAVRTLDVIWGATTTSLNQPSSAQTSQPFGKYYALIIGNNHYQHWEPLQNAISDAQAVGNVLRERYGFHVQLLQDATRKDILRALNALRKQLTERDNLLVYYAGHGYLEPNIDRGYWIPVEADLQDNSDWILLPTVTDLLQLMSAKHILVVADSCFAGKLTRSSLAQLRPGLTEEARMDLLKTLAEKRVRTALTSGGLRPVLDEGGKGHSVFAEAFLGVLKDNQEILETERIFLAIRNRVIRAAQGLNTEQIPTYSPIHLAGHESLGDFIFVPKPKGT